ncbi:ATP binding domain-containing protein [Cyclospora cayetanensis]|uniref:GPN-loop GTPase 2 n=1 Tax=Cyclospora cayetanensis TaxID=88456 RepID=A0A1D3D9B4_9EIME|nr:ATP binding domain-containing protein [Cyclospora cayetanensis]
MWYGQLVIGPPGSGKSSYCFGMQQMLDALGRRHIVVNLDPMNDLLPYKCDIDVMDLVKGEDVMNAHSLGPNGGKAYTSIYTRKYIHACNLTDVLRFAHSLLPLHFFTCDDLLAFLFTNYLPMIYCMEYLLENVDWLVDKLKAFTNSYVLIDCPGQVELFTHHDALRAIIRHLERLDFRMTAVQVVDSTLCTDAFKHISALLMSLNAQLQLELPHINVLSKVDLLRLHRKDLRFRLEFYADAYDVSALLQAMEDDPHPLGIQEESFVLFLAAATSCAWRFVQQKLLGFSRAVCELVEDFNLVSFLPVCVTDKECMLLVLRAADAANGFAMGNYATNERGYPLQLDTEEERQQMYASTSTRVLRPKRASNKTCSAWELMERLQEKYVDFDPEKDEAPIEEATEAE